MAISESQRLKELQHYHDTSVGLYCIDRDPMEVDIDWVRRNAFRLESVDAIEKRRREEAAFLKRRREEAAVLNGCHESDCAVHNGPAYPTGECDCIQSEKP